MCRNIKPLYNFDPQATDEEIHAAALQFVRKVSGYQHPSKANAKAFDNAIEEVCKTVRKLLDNLVTNAPQKSREIEAAKARARILKRFPS